MDRIDLLKRKERSLAQTVSTPALAAALRETARRSIPLSIYHSFSIAQLVPMYQLTSHTGTDHADAAKIESGDIAGNNAAHEAKDAVQLVYQIAERLRRLGAAYEEWDVFDSAAYFDISDSECCQLVTVTERVTSVYVTFNVDLLLPSFQAAESFWANHFYAAYHTAYPLINPDVPVMNSSDNNQSNDAFDSAFVKDFVQQVQPEMIERWQHLIDVLNQARRMLADDIGFLIMNGGQEERARWRSAWNEPSSPGLDPVLCPNLQTVPTLFLSFEFPLPTHRQSGRLRRLRMNRRRRTKRDR
ncbi:hypothetical protein KFU94_45350 [Chloroflexi bacterium TSY]|nr:hypothetical protein [Chloroflexi bacterium TSY]